MFAHARGNTRLEEVRTIEEEFHGLGLFRCKKDSADGQFMEALKRIRNLDWYVS